MRAVKTKRPLHTTGSHQRSPGQTPDSRGDCAQDWPASRISVCIECVWLAFGILQTRIVNFLLPKCRHQIVSIVFKIKFLFGILGSSISSIDRAVTLQYIHPSVPPKTSWLWDFKKKKTHPRNPWEYQTIFGISWWMSHDVPSLPIIIDPSPHLPRVQGTSPCCLLLR